MTTGPTPEIGEMAYLRVRVVQGPIPGKKGDTWIVHGVAADGSQHLFPGLVGRADNPLIVRGDQLVLCPGSKKQ